MPEVKTIFENDEIKVTSTGRDYDFIATVENKESHPVVIAPVSGCGEDCEFEPFMVEAEDWVGIDANDDGWRTVNAVASGNFDIAEPERWEDIDNEFGTSFADNYTDSLDR